MEDKQNNHYMSDKEVLVWRTNVRMILRLIARTQADLAKECGLSRVSISMMLTRKGLALTRMQWLGVQCALNNLIRKSSENEEIKCVASSCLQKIFESAQ